LIDIQFRITQTVFMTFRRQLLEIASWRIATEIVRRRPKDLYILELHPGGGMYDCLSVFHDRHHSLIDLNRNGSIHLFQTITGRNVQKSASNPDWDVAFSKASLDAVVKRFCDCIRLLTPAKLPPSTPRVLAYRFIADWLAHTAFTLEDWSCRSGFFDTPDIGGGVIMKWFDLFPGARDRLRVPSEEAAASDSAYRFWFLCRDGDPVFCIETTGTGWDLSGKAFDLWAEYRKARRTWPVLYHALGSHMG
jgi:hypothetical protein